ncbi:MerR family transcriptional regulator [Cellulosimicrobium arenosum]|uniref:MerR family transcriptional regulator n=1 Tax=Cellulosimicrobium arenosum TaxID=2708133 RepID=A0A927G7V0_9MICO|nr:MerR family transcriptional regulator [Cellulosimicrobium arenosum]MBD8078333.1 MerR family transcriptional regulator [Cellulosimicrobium arenosum]
MTRVRSAPDHEGARSSAPAPGLAVAVVARRLGVAPATLRTWDRRYGLGPSEHEAGAHRRYIEDDVARLMVMRQLTLDGVAPADAARVALDADAGTLDAHREAAAAATAGGEDDPRDDDAPDDVAGPPAGGGRDGGVRGVTPKIAGAPDDANPARAGQSPQRPGRGFLRAVPAGGDDPEPVHPGRAGAAAGMSGRGGISAVLDAAIAYDQGACDRLLRIPADGDPAVWWSELVEPALGRLAERTVLAGPGAVPEVVLANATLGALREHTQQREEAMVAAGGPPPNHPSRMRRIVLVFAAPDEPLPLAAHALAAALGAHGAMARIVTGPANVHRTLELVTMVRPAAVAMVTMQARPDLGIVHATYEANPDLPVFVGLPSDDVADEIPLAASVQRVRSFPGMLHELLAVVA